MGCFPDHSPDYTRVKPGMGVHIQVIAFLKFADKSLLVERIPKLIGICIETMMGKN